MKDAEILIIGGFWLITTAWIVFKSLTAPVPADHRGRNEKRKSTMKKFKVHTTLTSTLNACDLPSAQQVAQSFLDGLGLPEDVDARFEIEQIGDADAANANEETVAEQAAA